MNIMDSKVDLFVNNIAYVSKYEIKKNIGELFGRVIKFFKNIPSECVRNCVFLATVIEIGVIALFFFYLYKNDSFYNIDHIASIENHIDKIKKCQSNIDEHIKNMDENIKNIEKVQKNIEHFKEQLHKEVWEEIIKKYKGEGKELKAEQIS